MIRRLLVANRGEIVCRIARTARRLGVTTIAVYSDADRNAQHVRSADEAYHLGAAPAAESYLNIGKLIALAQRVGADAIHPGYGFLSENAGFAQACVDAGLIFVGPPAAAIQAMGSKSASKAAMAAVGVPVAPGYHGSEQSIRRLSEEALRVGFPLIIKASAGGGGKGMQVVNSAAEVAAAVESAQRLARTAFGDDRLLMERYFPRARHVEVQIFADLHGRTLSLFDRDCSVQRRHQKIIEEAPAPGLRDEVRAAMAQAAIKSAQAVGYVGAGTVEFLLDDAQNFYFMEMNTRLQVEHPVTELITGIDLVEWQLRVAQGEPLPATDDLKPRGHAVEARLYAEDPAHDYLPSVGRIVHLRWAQALPGVRQDTGVEAGDEVSSYYDPMLGKIIAWGESRVTAIDRLRRALGEIEIVGVATNRALLGSVLGDEEFRRGALATNFLGVRREQLGFGDGQPVAAEMALAAVWCAARRIRPQCALAGHARLAAGGAGAHPVAVRRVRGERRVGGSAFVPGAQHGPGIQRADSRVRCGLTAGRVRRRSRQGQRVRGRSGAASVVAGPARRAESREHRRCLASARHRGAGFLVDAASGHGGSHPRRRRAARRPRRGAHHRRSDENGAHADRAV